MKLSLPNHYFDFLLHYFPIWVSVCFIFYVCISIMEELSRKLIGIFNCISALLLALALVFFFFFLIGKGGLDQNYKTLGLLTLFGITKIVFT